VVTIRNVQKNFKTGVIEEDQTVMKCDFCDKEMDVNETSIFIITLTGRVEEGLGGHPICAFNFQKQIMVSGLEE
jgi:hypothetical protein